MHTTCGDEEDIVLFHRFVIEHRLQIIVFQHIDIVHPCHLAVEAHDEFCILFSLHHIPHLGLAIAQTSFFCQLVIGVYLHREPVISIDDLEQQGELFSILVEDALAHQVAHEGLHQVVDFVALEVAIGNFTLLIPNT